LILRNSQGALLYAATDLMTIMQRQKQHFYSGILYVVDQRQALHFEQLFEVAKKFGTFEHIGFGTVNDSAGKPFKTREGNVPSLSFLIQSAIDKAAVKNPDPKIALAVAVAGLKFGDLINKRTTNYAFDLDKALDHEGKTGPYVLYQYVRLQSIFKKAGCTPSDAMFKQLTLTSDKQREVAVALMMFERVLDLAWRTRMPHHIAEYVYDLCQKFSSFYQVEKISDSESNLKLAALTLDRLEKGLHVLGIDTVDEM
jgi:arginyl-tRNA synthetase